MDNADTGAYARTDPLSAHVAHNMQKRASHIVSAFMGAHLNITFALCSASAYRIFLLGLFFGCSLFNPEAFSVYQAAVPVQRTTDFIDKLEPQTLRSFDSAFGAISDGLHLTTIAEGIPLHANLTEQELAGVEKALSNAKNDPLIAKVYCVASAFDYDVSQADKHTFLLRKRYSDPVDLPCVTYSEVVHALRSLLDVTDLYAPAPLVSGTDTSSFDFYESLKPDQLGRAVDSISLGDLDPTQRSLALAAARQVALESRTGFLREILRHLQTLQNARTKFKWNLIVNEETFTYEGPFGPQGAIWQFPLNNGFMVQSGSGVSRPSMRELAIIAPSAASSPGLLRTTEAEYSSKIGSYDPSAPTDLDRKLAPGMLSNRIAFTATLAEATAKFSAANPKDPKFTVEDGIGDKPVCLFGTEYSDPSHIIRNFAEIYGLQVVSREANYFSLTFPRPRTTSTPAEAASELHRLLPDPIIRYLDGQVNRIADTNTQTTPLPSGLSERTRANLEKAYKEQARSAASNPASEALYFPADRRLLVLAIPAVPLTSSPPVEVRSVDPEVMRLISLMMLSGPGLLQMSQLKTFIPPTCLAEPEKMQIRLKMVTPHGRESLLIKFGYNDDSGVFHAEAASIFNRQQPQHSQ